MAIFGSSNWTASSSDTQREHNYFTRKPWIVDWFADQFLRKWANRMAAPSGGGAISPPMFEAFAPRPPGKPAYQAPANGATNQGTSVRVSWEGGSWAHKYDIYLGTSNSPPLAVQDFMPGSATAGVRSTTESYTLAGLAAGTTYYWRVVGKTMADKTTSGPVWHFTTGGSAPAALSDTRAASVTTSVYGSTTTGWSESTVTWKTRPAVQSTVLGKITVRGTPQAWYQLDITSYVQSRRAAGATLVTLGLKNTVDTLPLSRFNSTEASSGRPQIVVTRTTSP